MSKYLVTTALEETWPDKNEEILFLGEWCKLYDRRNIWSKLTHKVAPYHWDDRDKLYKDYIYLDQLYDILLEEFTNGLNNFHNIDKSKRYWEILIGYWLGWFIHIIFDRWSMLKYVIEEYDDLSCKMFNYDSKKFIHKGSKEFCNEVIYDDWNQYLYSFIIVNEFESKIKIENIKYNIPQKDFFLEKEHLSKRVLYIALNLYNKFTQRDSNCFIKNSYLPKKYDIYLQLKMGQCPTKIVGRELPSFNVSDEYRQTPILNENQSEDDFLNLARKLLSTHLPTIFLEGYKESVAKVKECDWPKNPRSIFASNSFHNEDYFKYWLGEKVSNGVPLIIGQHGGNFGMSKFAFQDKYQFNISDKWLSWGWGSKNSKIVPFGNLKNFDKPSKYVKNDLGLLILMNLPRYSYYLYSCPISSTQVLSYFDDQIKFYNLLPYYIQKKFKVRTHHIDFGHSFKSRIKDNLDTVQLCSDDYHNSIKKSKLIISTYNATTYLETMNLDVPTICFWNPKHWEVNRETEKYFSNLIDVGILHYSPDSAAAKVIEVWDNVEDWWNSSTVVKAKQLFTNNFSKHVNSLNKLSHILKN